MAKGIEPSDSFKKKMSVSDGKGKLKVKVKAKGKVSPSMFANLFKGMNQ